MGGIGSLTSSELSGAEERATWLLDLHKRLSVMTHDTYIKLQTFRDDCRGEQEDRGDRSRRAAERAGAG